MLKGPNITIKDIAKKLGLSTSTVSRAITGSSEISAKTKEAVLETARSLDYQPNTLAQSLKKKHTNIFGVVIPETINRFFSRAIAGIQDVAFKNGYNIMSCQSNETTSLEQKNTQALINARVDGLIVSVASETQNFSHFEKLIDKGIPIVFFDRVVDGIDAPKVLIDNYEAAFKATSHLIQMGCKRIARINGPTHLNNAYWRLKGYIDALQHHNLPIDDDLIILTSYNRRDDAENMVKHLLGLSQPPDGIFAINDECAMQLIHILHKKGYRVPDDIAFVGFNNDVFSPYIIPPLTTIDVPAFKLGQISARILLEMQNDEELLPEKRIVPSRLVIRESSQKKPLE